MINNLPVVFLITSILLGCQSTTPVKEEWTAQDKQAKFAEQKHHWGQKGQLSPNNGWSDYGSLKMLLSSSDYLLIHQWQGELLAEVYSTKSIVPQLRAMSIPGAGIFYTPKKTNYCKPDKIEQLGIYAEIALFYISQLFPDGPDNITDTDNTFKASGSTTEIRFMQAVANMKDSWSVEATLKLLGENHYEIKLNDKGSGKTLMVEWSKQQQQIISAAEPVANWLTCWSGTHTTGKSGNKIFKPDFTEAESISTFGEIREP